MRQLDKQVYGPWALVTGASSGIGEEFARQVVPNGINVVLVARREDKITEATGDLDIGLLVSNAGTGNPGPFIALPRERLREIVQLNVITHLDLAHHFGQGSQRGRGGIVLVSAVAAAGGLPYLANDSATKACLPPQPRRGPPRRAGPGGRQRDRSRASTGKYAGRRPHRPRPDRAAGRAHQP